MADNKKNNNQFNWPRYLQLALFKNTIILSVCPSKILDKYCFYFLLGMTTVPRETGNNAYAEFWRDKQRVLWYFLIGLIDHFTVVCFVAWPLNEGEAGGDLALIETFQLFLC